MSFLSDEGEAQWAEALAEDKIYTVVRCNSHRARRKMYQAIGEQQSYFSWDREGEFYLLDSSRAKLALEIIGISKARDGNDLHKTMSI